MEIVSWRAQLASLAEPLPIDKLGWPKSPAKSLLAYLHSGDVLRHSLPRLLRLATVGWLGGSILLWLFVWPAIYEAYERWGLVKAFIAHLLWLAIVFLLARLTLLRARQLEKLPADDFVSLRSLTVLFRWVADLALVYVVGTGLKSVLQPVGALMSTALSGLAPGMAGEMSAGAPTFILLSAPLSVFFVAVAGALFVGLYSLATAIDVYLAIEFNTRSERMGKGL